jgi:hypothetical protein
MNRGLAGDFICEKKSPKNFVGNSMQKLNVKLL